MYQEPKNPNILELTQSHKARRINLSGLDPITVDGIKLCVWCLSPLRGAQRKWCSPLCSQSAFAWANPQKEEGLAFLLARQGYCCLICGYDWNPLADTLLGKYGIRKAHDRLTTCSRKFVKILKNRSPEGTQPEVDHGLAISKGGQSLGFFNTQVLCKLCHKAKTRIDNSGPRNKNTTKT